MSNKASPARWVLVPAVITLVVTLVRLGGELLGGDPTLFSTEAGGGQVPISEGPGMPSWFGIFLLMPVFGMYFGMKLARAGQGPESRGKALGLSVLALVLAFAVMGASMALGGDPTAVAPPPTWLGPAMWVALWLVAVLVARRAWPQLFMLNCLYGFAARIPVVLVTLALSFVFTGEDRVITHFE
jgi:hypothetical protein